MITIKPYLRIYGKNPTDGVVWLYFYVNRQKVHFTTKVSCKIEHWLVEEYRVKMIDPAARDKNLIIETIIGRINNVFVKFRLKDVKMTRDSFLRAYNRPSDYDTFHAFYKDYDKKHSYKIEGSTWHSQKMVMDKLKEFNPDLHFDDMDHDWLDLYYSYLRKDLNNNENTAYKNMSIIRKYVNAAFKAGYFDENPFADWKIKLYVPQRRGTKQIYQVLPKWRMPSKALFYFAVFSIYVFFIFTRGRCFNTQTRAILY